MKRVWLMVLVLCSLLSVCVAENETYWVMCNPDSYVNIRETPRKTGREGGYLLYGDSVEVDGRRYNGYWHIVNCPTEMGEGWVKGLYLVDEMPGEPDKVSCVVVSNGRVAARNGVNGERRKWLKPGMEITVYGMTSEWAVTNQGYVMSRYLEAK